MIEPLFEIVFTGLMEWATEYAPRPIRIGCISILICFVVALLVWALWPWK